MSRRTMRSITVVGIVAFALASTGCGSEGKKVEPKADANAPKLEKKAPGGPGGGAQPGAPKSGSQ